LSPLQAAYGAPPSKRRASCHASFSQLICLYCEIQPQYHVHLCF
jgi:hypothetical protein